ncbi:enoyl-CoA hydratase-related protein [Azospirillum sp. B4]|uniref:enoyl-CoA hydratase-related protein n=1 Tax=Azospirillum sp. B4 TaxID=95605 RepID=UPI000678AE4B|nr:enoyl-CoA hydratase-related protein [Azospirillum sp. B4]
MTPPLTLSRRGSLLMAELSRPASGNTLNAALVTALSGAIDQLETDDSLRVLAILGRDGVFCDGMDFTEAAATEVAAPDGIRQRIVPFWRLLTRIAQAGKPVVAGVDGRVSAGGLGLAAACDLVFATPRSGFILTELLFGLVPATIAPFLVRRTGVQAAWRLTLTAQRVDAAEARGIGLVDEVVADVEEALRRVWIKVDRMDPAAIAAAKAYFREMAPIDAETERRAIDLICARIADPATMIGIRRFVEGGGLPWRKP